MRELQWKVNLYRGYLAICHTEERQLSLVEKLVEMSSVNAIREWRRLPHIVSHIHVQYLQVRERVLEWQGHSVARFHVLYLYVIYRLISCFCSYDDVTTCRYALTQMLFATGCAADHGAT